MSIRASQKPPMPTSDGDARMTQDLSLRLWQTTNAWQRHLRDALAPLNLTHVQFVLLAALTGLVRDGMAPPTQRELARYTRTDEMMVSQTLRTLERKGLVERIPDPADRRARRLRPTPTGRRAATAATVVVAAVDATLSATLGRDAAAFERGLGRLAEAVPSARRPPGQAGAAQDP